MGTMKSTIPMQVLHLQSIDTEKD